jgi:hypothetical protein
LKDEQIMDGYIIGFIGISGISLLVGIMAIVLLSFDGDSNEHDRRISYKQVRHITTNTIETVNFAGEKEVWQRSA